MRKVHYSTKYKKDVKRYENRYDLLQELYEIVKYLEQDIPIPSSFYPHKLKGIYKGCWECHIRGNFLLIWVDESSGDVKLLRLGTHQELFGM